MCQFVMCRLQSCLSTGLVTTIVVMEILGLMSLPPTTLPPDAIVSRMARPYRRAAGAKRWAADDPVAMTVGGAHRL
jgi:hypothetical protein